MKQDQILSYYKRLIYKSSLPLLTFSLGLVTLLFFLFILKQDNERTHLNNEHKEVLATQMIESLENTYLMIGKSSHSIIALKYEDYAGYRRVVLPWIQSDPRITSIILTDANGKVKIEWSKLDRKVSYANISESSKLV